MFEREKLVLVLKRQQWIIDEQSKGLSHQDSLLQLPFRANCFNWVVGHIVVYRDIMLELMGELPILTTDRAQVYHQGSEPLSPDDDVVELKLLVEVSLECLNRLESAIRDFPDEKLGKIHNEKRGTTVGDRIEFLVWHEGYHVGQLEILRQVAGMDDAII